MTQISLHIMDLAQNSIVAGATVVEIDAGIDHVGDKMWFSIKDNGKGMSAELLERVLDPFTTTRTTRPVGMGLSLTKAAAEQADGEFSIKSELGVGTEVFAQFRPSHIDCQPMGDLASTLALLISGNPQLDFKITYKNHNQEFALDTVELRGILGDVPFDNNDVAAWLLGYLRENIKEMQ